MKILLIEDDKVQADTLAKLLEKAGDSKRSMKVEVAGDLATGIAKSHELHPDVCYLDLCLPGTTIEEVIQSIDKIYPPVIIISAMDDPDQTLKLNCFAHGAQNYFQKQRDMKLLVPHLLSTGAAAHLRREAPRRLAENAASDRAHGPA